MTSPRSDTPSLLTPPADAKQTQTASHWLRDGILISRANSALVMDVDEAREITKIYKALSSLPRPILVIFSRGGSQSRACRDYFSNDPDHLTTYSAVALVAGSPVAKVLANFFMGLNRPQRPTRMFTDPTEARAWLEQFKVAP